MAQEVGEFGGEPWPWNLGEEPGDVRCGAMLLVVLTAKGCLGNTVSVNERVGAMPAAGRPSQGNRD